MIVLVSEISKTVNVEATVPIGLGTLIFDSFDPFFVLNSRQNWLHALFIGLHGSVLILAFHEQGILSFELLMRIEVFV